MPWLISAAQADKFRKSQKSLLIFDASLHMHNEEKDPYQDFLNRHIVGAQFFDINAFHDPHAETPNTLIQDEKVISEKLSAIGLRNDYKIIFYDNSNLHSACRALWMMKVFGHNPHLLYILDGGLAAWEKYVGKIESGNSSVTAKQYNAKLQPQLIHTLDQMKENLRHPKEQVIDVRHPVRFAGGPEPRPGMRSGHIPGSFSFPFTAMFDKNTNQFLPLPKIRQLLTSLGVDMNTSIISMCGSGVTASILDFALDLIGHPSHQVYAGSWAEWGAEKLYKGEKNLEERPVETCVEELLPRAKI